MQGTVIGEDVCTGADEKKVGFRQDCEVELKAEDVALEADKSKCTRKVMGR